MDHTPVRIHFHSVPSEPEAVEAYHFGSLIPAIFPPVTYQMGFGGIGCLGGGVWLGGLCDTFLFLEMVGGVGDVDAVISWQPKQMLKHQFT